MSRHPNSRSSQMLTGDENFSKAMGAAKTGPDKGKPQGDKATAGAKGPKSSGPAVAKWSPGKVSNTGNKSKS